MRLGLLAAATLLVGLLGAGPVFAQADADCKLSVGQWVDIDDGPGVTPGYVVSTSDLLCTVEVRVPGQPFDPYLGTYWEPAIEVLPGKPEGAVDYGCPYGLDVQVDVRDADGDVWNAGRVRSFSDDCTYEVTYWTADLTEQSATLSGFDVAMHLRPGTIALPNDAQQQAARDAAAQAKLCPPGGQLADYAGDGEAERVMSAIVLDRTRRSGGDFSVYADTILRGDPLTVADGGTFLSKHPDARIGGQVDSYRLELRECRQNGDAPETTSFLSDYNCYTDKFQQFVCKVEAETELQ
jgi:hypothetical protein